MLRDKILHLTFWVLGIGAVGEIKLFQTGRSNIAHLDCQDGCGDYFCHSCRGQGDGTYFRLGTGGIDWVFRLICFADGAGEEILFRLILEICPCIQYFSYAPLSIANSIKQCQ